MGVVLVPRSGDAPMASFALMGREVQWCSTSTTDEPGRLIGRQLVMLAGDAHRLVIRNAHDGAHVHEGRQEVVGIWEQIDAMLNAIGVGYLGAGVYIAIVIFIFWLIGRRGGGKK